MTDEEFAAVRAKAHPTVQDAMDVALLTGQRPSDVLKIKRNDLRDGVLFVTQNNTKAKRAIERTGELGAVIDRVLKRPRVRNSAFLIQDDAGSARRSACLRYGGASPRPARPQVSRTSRSGTSARRRPATPATSPTRSACSGTRAPR